MRHTSFLPGEDKLPRRFANSKRSPIFFASSFRFHSPLVYSLLFWNCFYFLVVFQLWTEFSRTKTGVKTQQQARNTYHIELDHWTDIASSRYLSRAEESLQLWPYIPISTTLTQPRGIRMHSTYINFYPLTRARETGGVRLEHVGVWLAG
jgi:hypothetical protein